MENGHVFVQHGAVEHHRSDHAQFASLGGIVDGVELGHAIPIAEP